MDDMEEVRQRFEADVQEYLANVEEVVASAQEFAAASREAKDATDGLRDAAAETAPVLGHVRDEALAAAEAMGIYRDEAGRWRDSSGRFAAAAELEALGIGHVRDEALEAALAVRKLKNEEQDASRAGLFSRLGGLFNKAGGGIPMGSGLLSGPAMLAIIPAVEALLPLLAGVLAGLAATGAGAGAFALLAVPAVKSVASSYAGLNSVMQKYQKAVALENLDPSKAHLKAVQAAADQVTLARQAIAKLPPDEQKAIDGISRLTHTFGNMSKAFAPEAFKVFSDVLKLANELLPAVTPFAKTFADSISGLLGKATSFAGSGFKDWFSQFSGVKANIKDALRPEGNGTGFKDWLNQFHALEGPSIKAIGDGIGKVAVAIGKLLTAMSAKDVVNAINIAFGILAGTISVITYVVKRLMDNWDGMSVAAKHTWYDIRQWSHDVSKAFDTVRHFAAEMGHDTAAWFDFIRHHAAILAHDIAAHFDEIRHDIAQWAGDVRHDADLVIGWFEKLPGRIMHALGDLGHLLWNAGAAMLRGFLGGIESGWHDVTSFVGGIAGWISGHKGPIEADAVLLRPHGIAIMRGLISGLKVGMGDTMAYVTGIAQGLSQQIAAALSGGQITAAQAASLSNAIISRLAADSSKVARAAAKLSLDFNGALTRSLEDPASASAAKSAVAKLAGYVKQAWTAGLIGTGRDSAITSWLDTQSARLQALAGQRQKITAEITQARQFAASTASATAGNYAISGFATTGLMGGASTVGQIIGGLRVDVAQIRKFKTNILKLAKEGLNKSYLGQLIALGPVNGGALAQELADANLGDIKTINSLESQISHVSGQLGKQAADEMYDAGKYAGRGFLSGLEAQKKAITQLMESIARSMIATLKKELGIISAPPHGGAGGLAGAGGYAGGTSVHVAVPVTVQGGAGGGYQSPEFMQYMQRTVQEAVLRYGQLNPNNGFTPAWGRG